MEEKELEKKAPGEAEAENIPENGAGAENTAENAAGPAGASADGEAAPENGKEEKKEKKGLFGKKKDPRDTQIEELTDQLKRSMADKEKSTMYEIGARDVIEKILPVVDNFERGLATVPEDAKETPFAEGMEKIYKQLMKTLDDMGVKPIEAVGKPFDPNFHNAVMHVDDESLGENVVASELLKGYMYRDTVVRHSMVQVAN